METHYKQPWFITYERYGIAPTIKLPTAHESLLDVFEAGFSHFGAQSAYLSGQYTLSYPELETYSRHLASHLQAFGLVKGDTVGVMLPNVLAYPVIVLAVLRAGLTLVSFNPAYTPRELTHQLVDSGVQMLFTLPKYLVDLTRVTQASLACVRAIVLCPAGQLPVSVSEWVRHFLPPVLHRRAYDKLPPRIGLSSWLTPHQHAYQRPAIAASDAAVIQYTGGTTGMAKGAILSHGNLLANVRQVDALLQSGYPSFLPKFLPKPELIETPFASQSHEIPDVILVALPMYHVFSLMLGCFLTVYRGFTGLLIANPQDFVGLVSTLKRQPPQYILGVNPLFSALLQTSGFEQLDFSSLKATIGGGMAINPQLAKRWHTVTGLPIIEGYGLSETAPVATFNPLTIAEFTNKVGIPAPSTDIVLIDEHDRPVPIGERGELAIKGPQVMQGYHNLPDLRDQLFTKTGYFRSGDIGIMDERGFFKIVDRKKDMIVVSGFNVYPAEIEAVMLNHPDIVECVAIGIPSASRGEEPKLYVVRANPTLTEQAVIEFGKRHLTGYQRPRHVSFVDKLPKSLLGKTLRKALRQQEGLE